MKKSTIRQYCQDIFAYFNNIDNNHSDAEYVMGGSRLGRENVYLSCIEITGGKIKKLLDLEEELEEDEKDGGGYPSDRLCAVAFALGYVFREMLEVPYPKFQKEVDAIKEGIKELKTLPYFPREPKATATLTK